MDSLGFEGDENFVNSISTISTVGVGAGDPAATVTIQDSDGTLISFFIGRNHNALIVFYRANLLIHNKQPTLQHNYKIQLMYNYLLVYPNYLKKALDFILIILFNCVFLQVLRLCLAWQYSRLLRMLWAVKALWIS